eukprot:6172706-Pleurochrysis_carterae.AAC.2
MAIAQTERRAERKPPLLYMDVNLGPGKTGRIGLHEGDDPAELALNFSRTYSLDSTMRKRLQQLIERYMAEVVPGYTEQARTHSYARRPAFHGVAYRFTAAFCTNITVIICDPRLSPLAARWLSQSTATVAPSPADDKLSKSASSAEDEAGGVEGGDHLVMD